LLPFKCAIIWLITAAKKSLFYISVLVARTEVHLGLGTLARVRALKFLKLNIPFSEKFSDFFTVLDDALHALHDMSPKILIRNQNRSNFYNSKPTICNNSELFKGLDRLL
jgi:hypothetical protein